MKSVTKKIQWLVAAVILTAGSNALAECYTELADIATVAHIDNISARWVQTDSEDGKPVTINLEERGDGLFVSFIKDGHVLTEGHVQVCQDNNNQMVLKPIGRLVPGRNAPPELSGPMSNPNTRIRFNLPSENQMRVRITVPIIFGATKTVPFAFQAH